jgi:AAA domain
MRELREEDPHAKHWVMVPEAAPLLFQAGLDARLKSFQIAVVRLQIQLETIFSEAASPEHVLICHRGTLDALAYWLRNGWREADFFVQTKMSQEEHFKRYSGVLHLQTTAIGAEPYYRYWPDAHRREDASEAAEIDGFCSASWARHPTYSMVENDSRRWEQKSDVARSTLHHWVALKRPESERGRL